MKFMLLFILFRFYIFGHYWAAIIAYNVLVTTFP